LNAQNGIKAKNAFPYAVICKSAWVWLTLY